VDTGTVSLDRVDDDGTTPVAGRTSVATASDGNGFYGGVDVAPGTFHVTVMPVGQAPYTSACTTEITTGRVTTFDIAIDRAAPSGTLAADPAVLWPPNHEMVTVTLSGDLADVGTGLESVAFRVLDEYGTVEPSIEPLTGGGLTALAFSRTFELEASRGGDDRDGRTYTIEATVADRACQKTTLRKTVVVPHDRRK